MSSRNPSCFGYEIRAAGEGWSWVTYDLSGAVEARGWAPHKAMAAACVVRALARAAAPAPECDAA